MNTLKTKISTMITQKLSYFFILFCATSLLAFNPPFDTQQKVTLRIDGFDETADSKKLSSRIVPTDQPLCFTVHLVNNSDAPVKGVVTVGMNDDWMLNAPGTIDVVLNPGQEWKGSCTATAKDDVLSALYPIHARFSFARGEDVVTLHPIAIFMAERPSKAHAAPPPQTMRLSGRGRWPLTGSAAHAIAWERNHQITQLPADFNGGDPVSGASWVRDEVTCDGVRLQALSFHPPWKGGYGTLWSDYSVALPADQPVRFNFNMAIRKSAPGEPLSDGVTFRVQVLQSDKADKTLFESTTDSKKWQPAEVDLSPYAGETITLRLWNSPGPRNDTTCDNGFWGNPMLEVGEVSAPDTPAMWAARSQEALRLARAAVTHKPKASNVFRLKSGDELIGAAVVPGDEGLIDGVIAFSDGTHELAIQGFAVEVDGQPAGDACRGALVQSVDVNQAGGGVLEVTHHLQNRGCDTPVADAGQALPVQVRIWADKGVLRIAWKIALQEIKKQNTAWGPQSVPVRLTKIAPGSTNVRAQRIYLGFGAVYDQPGEFTLNYHGVLLSTRHIGADYAGGLSLVQATDLIPDRLVCTPSQNLFTLESPYDSCFMLAPSAKGAYAAARIYSKVCGFEKSPGVDNLLGRVCLDQWGGGPEAAVSDLGNAAKYGLNHSVFVKHDWQRWGYDYRLPEIYPPHMGLVPFADMRIAARQASMLFAPHDNYIDFYPDAEGFSYDHIVFNADGTPYKAWFNRGRQAQSYRWRPDAFTPWMTSNMQQMRKGFAPDSLFIDVFTSVTPFDFYDRSGNFHNRDETVKEWSDAFDRCRDLLGDNAVMLSETGHDALIGSIDGVQADHWEPERWLGEFKDADRTPWHDMVTHGKMVLFAGGLADRYNKDPQHGYGSDDYLSNTVLGGRGPMCDGPFSRRAVMTYWLLHDVCNDLAHAGMEEHSFGPGVRQQHTTFTAGGEVWANRGSNLLWSVAEKYQLSEYGFYARTQNAEAGVILLNGHRAAFASTKTSFFADARTPIDSEPGCFVSTGVTNIRKISPRVYQLTFEWEVLKPLKPGYVPFIHIGRAATNRNERIDAQADMIFDYSLLTQAGTFQSAAEIRLPQGFAPGDYDVRYGLFSPQNGDRIPLRGIEAKGRRISAGTLQIREDGDSCLPAESAASEPGFNAAGTMVDFGPLVTDGAFRLIHSERREWQLTPLPSNRPFNAKLRLAAFGAEKREVKSIELIDPSCDVARVPQWSQSDGWLNLTCDSLSFGYRILF